MKQFWLIGAGACASLISHGAEASVACTVLNNSVTETTVTLYAAPDAAAAPLRQVPSGDLVLYPQADLAPKQAAGWAWVRHDKTQRDIWQSGLYGWMPLENLTDCG
ncbi:hypothetical protein [Shimia sp. SDUM112013]|uniref:hypothetical protein n=1 Tax=Shimia sp. SDUM112013 TaxID=3136160 RepID=UPI0032EA979D